MARAINNGWDFIRVWNTYQYKEDWFIAELIILEDNSNSDYYSFKVKVLNSNDKPQQNWLFEVMHTKKENWYYSGMSQFYEVPEYTVVYWRTRNNERWEYLKK